MNGPTKPGRRSRECGDFASERANLLLRRGSSTARDAGSPSDSRWMRRRTSMCTTGTSPSGYGAEEMIHEETPSADPRDPADAAPTPRPVCRRERHLGSDQAPVEHPRWKDGSRDGSETRQAGNDVQQNLTGRQASYD